jgi:hypothetical protein
MVVYLNCAYNAPTHIICSDFFLLLLSIPIPMTMYSCTEELDLPYNKITGNIPTQLGNMSNLRKSQVSSKWSLLTL